jgi:putative Ca2+/H+ antiporter (TMEM165/GDT1 family)
MRLRTDDDIYRARLLYLGPPGYTLPVHLPYGQYGAFAALLALFMFVRWLLTREVDLFPAIEISLALVATSLIFRYVDADRPATTVVRTLLTDWRHRRDAGSESRIPTFTARSTRLIRSIPSHLDTPGGRVESTISSNRSRRSRSMMASTGRASPTSPPVNTTLTFVWASGLLPVVTGVVVASALVMGASVLAGAALGTFVSTNVMQLVGGLIFLAFAVWTLISREEDEEDAPDEDTHPEPADDEDADFDEPSPGRQWLALAGQLALGVVGGSAVLLWFNWLWGRIPAAALIAALAIIVGLVWIVRKIRRADDLQTTVLAVLVGLVVTVSPAALLLLSR